MLWSYRPACLELLLPELILPGEGGCAFEREPGFINGAGSDQLGRWGAAIFGWILGVGIRPLFGSALESLAELFGFFSFDFSVVGFSDRWGELWPIRKLKGCAKTFQTQKI